MNSKIKYISILVILFFFGCLPFEYEKLQKDIYSVNIDASAYPFDDNKYFIYQIEDFADTIRSGEIKTIAFSYYSGVICQIFLDGSFSNCIQDFNEDTANLKISGNPIADLIAVNFTKEPDSVFINRHFPLTRRLNTVLCNNSKNYLLPAETNSNNRLIFYRKNAIILDTVINIQASQVTINL